MDERWDNNTDTGEDAPAVRHMDEQSQPPAPPVPPGAGTPPASRPGAVQPPADPSGLLTPGNYSSPVPPPGLTPPPPPGAHPPPPPQHSQPPGVHPQQPPPGVYTPPPGVYPPLPQAGYQPPGAPSLAPPAGYSYPVPAQPRPMPGAVQLDGAIWHPAGLGPRVLAFLLDGIILMLAGQVLVLAAGIPQPDIERVLELYVRMWSELFVSGVPSGHTMAQLTELMRPAQLAGWLNVAMCFCYYTAFHWLAGGTLGKLSLGLRVLRRDGRRLSLGWAALRYLGYLLCAKLIYTAWLVPLNAEKRTLYDIVLGTNVYKVKR